MLSVSKLIKNRLNLEIKRVSSNPKDFAKNPQTDFTRNRKLSLETTIRIILSMEGGSLSTELLKYFNYDEGTATSSAFIQARHKIKIEAFKDIFNRFSLPKKHVKRYRGYRLLAHDGSDVNLPNDCTDSETDQGNGIKLLHLNAFYDIINKVYLDVKFQTKHELDERASLIDMIGKSKIDGKVIHLCDRGYSSFNVFEHIKNAGHNFLIRTKDIDSNGFLANLDLPNTNTFDVDVSFGLSRLQTKEVKRNPNIKFISSSAKFDFLPVGSKDVYAMNLRVVRVKLGEDSYESLVTNLDRDEFPSEELKKLYHMRWGIETSFRELKYALGLSHLHAKTRNFIEQEIYAKMIMYNFCMMIALQVALRKKRTKWGYQVNFTRAIEICKHFFRYSGLSPPNVEALIGKYILPVRENRSDKRNLKATSFVPFIYRVA